MISIVATSGRESEGLRIKDPLEAKLLSGMTAIEKARAPGDWIKSILTAVVAVVEQVPLDEAATYVEANTESIH